MFLWNKLDTTSFKATCYIWQVPINFEFTDWQWNFCSCIWFWEFKQQDKSLGALRQYPDLGSTIHRGVQYCPLPTWHPQSTTNTPWLLQPELSCPPVLAGNWQAKQKGQFLILYCMASSAGSMCSPFFFPVTNSHGNDRTLMPLQPLLLSLVWEDLQNYWAAENTAYIWQVTRPEEVRKQSWKLLSVLGQNSFPKTDLDICLHYPLILADILMATFFLNKELLFWNKTFNLKGEGKREKIN